VVVDFQRGRRRWASEGHDISRTSVATGLNRDQVIYSRYEGYIQVIYRLYIGYQVIYSRYEGYIQVIYRLYISYQVIYSRYEG